MKLYAVFYFFGKVAALVGPWNDETYTKIEKQNIMIACEQARTAQLQRADVQFAKIPIMKDSNGVEIRRKDFSVHCEWHSIKPAFNYK